MFFHFSVEAVKSPILDIHLDPEITPKHTQHHLYPLLFFAIFSLNLSFRYALLSIFGNAYWILKTALQTSSPTVNTHTFHIWKCALYPENITHYDFSLIYFSFSIATPSVFRNAHWILKTAPQTSSPTVSTIPLCFYDFFPIL